MFGKMTVGELVDFLAEQPRDAVVLVCEDTLTPTKDSVPVTDALYVHSRKIADANVVILYDSEG